jgi:hypothetical protein
MSGTRVPGAAGAVVAPAKVRDYLLSRDHPDNDGKADFFALFGFARERWSELQSALMAHPANNEVIRVVPAGDGMRYRVRCNLASPDGRDPCKPPRHHESPHIYLTHEFFLHRVGEPWRHAPA